jgi:hypothetical protein
MIEDAKTAIYANMPVNPGTGVNIIKTEDAVFNRSIW